MIEIRNNQQLNDVLSRTEGGFTVVLDGTFDPIAIRPHYVRRVEILAYRALVRGVTVTGSNVGWHGGEIQASGGSDGFALAGYGVHLRNGCNNVGFNGVSIRNADRGFVLDRANNVWINGCDVSVRQDGIIANGGEGIWFLNNRFHNFYPRPTTCTIGDEVRHGLSRRDCEALGGAWRDGDHSDAIQLRNGMKNVVIAGNVIEIIQQGIGQMDATGDAPLDNVLVLNNVVRVNGFHSITISRCSNLRVIGNTTQQLTGRRSPLRLDSTAIQRDNQVLSP